MIYNKFGYKFVAPSKRENKKYDVYDKDDKYLASFGHKNYQQFYDKIGAYAHLNHKDNQRRKNYRSRHAKDLDNYPHAGYFSGRFLW
jgi:hypothetical protein